MAISYYSFQSTKKMFKDYLVGYSFPVSFDTWLTAPDDDKAALLFVNFYSPITLAWTKANAPYVLPEDAVSSILAVLLKNSNILSSDPNGYKRFTAGYFYVVAWGAFYSLIRSKANKLRNDSEICNEVEGADGDSTINLWDLVPSYDEPYETTLAKEAIWSIISDMGPKAEKVVNHLINPGDSLRANRKGNSHNDRLADVSVSKSEYSTILTELEDKLSPYLEYFS
jgi:hypothetical protein